MSPTPEQQARIGIDAALEAAGWIVQNRAAMNLAAGTGVAVREFRMASGHGFADYLLFGARNYLEQQNASTPDRETT